VRKSIGILQSGKLSSLPIYYHAVLSLIDYVPM
jgi:hypothetical protein